MAIRALFSFVAIYALINSIDGAPQIAQNNSENLVTDLASDLKNWMSLLPDDLRNVPINYLAIPGSHDSFTVDISSSSEVSPDGEEILRKLEFLSVVKLVMANWSKTQAFNITQQLEAGIRFFDLRICRNSDDENLYFCHAMYSTEVKSVLSAIAAYLDSHPKEVVILDCQHFYNFTTTTHPEVIQLLGDTFGDKIIPQQSSMDSLTLDYLAERKQQVLIVYRDSVQSGQAALWPTESFPTPWYDTMNSTYLISSLNNGLTNRPSAVGYISQLILTPSINDIIGNVLSTLKRKCAEDFEDTRTQWISEQTPGRKGVNVIIADFVDLTDDNFSKTVINLNQKLDISTLTKVGIFEKVATFFGALTSYIS